MPILTSQNCKCSCCAVRISTHKPRISCSICLQNFHPKCAKLVPNDILHLKNIDALASWTCFECNVQTFPWFALVNNNAFETPVSKVSSDRNRKRDYCNTCHKLGNSLLLVTCELCNLKSHKRCFAGILGCKSCARDTIPGYDVNVNELFGITGVNNARFNPFDSESDLNNIGFTGVFDDSGAREDWSSCSQLLNSCKYFEPNEVKCRSATEVKIFSLNIRCLKDKITSLIDNIDHYSKFDILCFNETSCSPDNLPFGGKELELIKFHPPIVQSPSRESSRGGGLVIYLNKAFCSINDYKVLSNLSENSDPANGEFLFIEITRKSKNIIIGNMYRSPSFEPDTFISHLEQKLELLRRHKNKHIILVSDSNIDLLKFQHFEPTTKLVNSLSEHGFVPAISIPTRVTSHSATLIDHIFVNNSAMITKSGVITEDISDHLATFVNLLIDPNKCSIMRETMTNYRPINDENLASFKNDISRVNWDFLLEEDSADEKFTLFETKYHEIYDKNFPIKTNKPRKRKCDKPWILSWLQCACDRKNRYYKEYVKHPTPENKLRYTKIKKFVAKHIKKSKRVYYENYFKKYSDDGRKKWQMINSLLNRNKKSRVGITKIKHNDTMLTDPKDIAQTFNDFFCNVAQRLKDGDRTAGALDRGRPPELTIDSSQRNLIDMLDIECTNFEIEKYISSLKNKATSDLAIQPLKFVNSIISPVLCHLISASLLQGVFPSRLKVAKVIPLHKGGSRVDVGNYRPISLLSGFSKIYEKAMHYRLTKFLNDHNIIHDSQYGFRSGHSCEHALLEAQSRLAAALDRKKIALLLLIDFSKAFDMVDHGILLSKLEHYGIRNHHLSWFRTYLTNRQQYVHVNNCDSDLLRPVGT